MVSEMKLVHTADVHLDACYAALGMPAGFGNRRREGLRDVFHRIVTRAAQWPADALLIAGDLFDLDRVSRDTVAFLQAEFDAVRPLPVVIAPGNRDPYVPRSPYVTASWPSNVVIFDSPAWKSHTLKDEKLIVHGFGFDGPEIATNPFGDLRVRRLEGRVQVAVGHGSERGHQPVDKEACAPFDAATAAVKGLDYLALGHFHSATPIEGEFDTVMHYAGAPEGHNFDETGPRYYLEVEIDDKGVRVTPVASSSVVYSTHTVDCSDFDTAEQVIEAIRAIGTDSEQAQVARVTLVGLCGPDLHISIPAIHGAAASAFEALDLVNAAERMEDYEELARENTCLGVFIRKLNEETADAPDEARRRFVKRARELGLAAYRQRQPAIYELEED